MSTDMHGYCDCYYRFHTYYIERTEVMFDPDNGVEDTGAEADNNPTIYVPEQPTPDSVGDPPMREIYQADLTLPWGPEEGGWNE